jgi:hypothetical protein
MVHTQTSMFPRSIAHVSINRKREKLIGSALFLSALLQLQAASATFFLKEGGKLSISE